MNLTPYDRTELLEILNVALYDANVAVEQSHDEGELAAYKDHQAKLRKWIHRLSQTKEEAS